MTWIHLAALIAAILFLWLAVFPQLRRGENATDFSIGLIRGRVWRDRLTFRIGTVAYERLIPFVRRLAWLWVAVAILVLAFVRYLDPPQGGALYLEEVQNGGHGEFVWCCLAALGMTVVTAWNDRRDHRRFSLWWALTVGPVGTFVMGDVLMWANRPHYGELVIDVLGAALCVISLFYLECLGAVIVSFARRSADIIDEGFLVNLLELLKDLVGEFVPALGRIFTSGRTGAVDQESWRVNYDRYWVSVWQSFAPFPLLAIVNEGVVVPYAAFVYAIWFGATNFNREKAGIDTEERRKKAVYALEGLSGLLLIDLILQYVVSGWLSSKMVIWNAATHVVRITGGTTAAWILELANTIAAGAIIGVSLYGLSLIPVVRNHDGFKKGIACVALGFISVAAYVLAPSAIARISEPTRAQVFANSPGVLVSWDTSFRGDGVVVRVRDQLGGSFKSIGWVDKQAMRWMYVPQRSGNYTYVACFVESGPSCAHDICLPEEIPPLQAGALCYEEMPLDVPPSSTLARN